MRRKKSQPDPKWNRPDEALWSLFAFIMAIVILSSIARGTFMP